MNNLEALLTVATANERTVITDYLNSGLYSVALHKKPTTGDRSMRLGQQLIVREGKTMEAALIDILITMTTWGEELR